MKKNKLGRTGLEISCLGAGLSEIGFDLSLDDVKQAGRVLNSAIDGGINFLDTAACYDISEELIGRTVAHRRDEYILATKAGHTTDDYAGESWTAKTVTDSIDRSLKRMKTDYVDLVQLHSCDVEVLEQGDVIEALLDAQLAGKTRFVGYSGDNEAAEWAIKSGLFDTLQTSFNLVEQRARTHLFPLAKEQNMGIIIKRPIGNGVWGAKSSPRPYADDYFARAQQMEALGDLPDMPSHRILLALGFVMAHDITTAIVGTQNPKHMALNIQWLENDLPISQATINELYKRYETVGQDWKQLT